MIVNIEDSHGVKHVTVSETIDIPENATADVRYQMGKDAKVRLRNAIAEAIEPYIEINAHTLCSGEFTTTASLTLLNAKALKGERDESQTF